MEAPAPAGLWYFAFGANMSRATLARRSLTPLASERASVEGYRFAFSHPGVIPYLEPAFANLELDAEGRVHGVLHCLSEADMQRLDRTEGVGYSHVELRAVGSESGPVSARAYLDPHPVHGRMPSRRYLSVCCAGAREFGLPEDYVQTLANHPSRHVPLLSPLLTSLVGTYERLHRIGLHPERLRMAVQGQKARAQR